MAVEDRFFLATLRLVAFFHLLVFIKIEKSVDNAIWVTDAQSIDCPFLLICYKLLNI